jgi:hypothetical protein
MKYERTQWGLIAVPLLVVALVLLVVLSFVSDEFRAALIWTVVFLIAISLLVLHFSRLTVTVDDVSVTAAFGYIDWPKREIRYDEIESAQKVRNKWWYGYGVRWVPGGTMYNVQGNDAVELTYTSGKKFRIGTNDVDALYTAISSHVPDTTA